MGPMGSESLIILFILGWMKTIKGLILEARDPSGNGFFWGLLDGDPTPGTLGKGVILDRYGDNNGAFLSREGVEFDQRALGPGDGNRVYRRYEVLKPLPIIEGEIAPAFGKSGGGTQILPKLPDRVNIQWLIDNGYLRELD